MGRGPWRGIALFLLAGIALAGVALAGVAGIAYNVGVDHGTTVEVVGDGEAVRHWGGPWRDGGFFFPIFPILFLLFFGFLCFNLLRFAFGGWGGGRHGWGGPPWAGAGGWTRDDVRAMRDARFDDWHRRSHERIEGRASTREPDGTPPDGPAPGGAA